MPSRAEALARDWLARLASWTGPLVLLVVIALAVWPSSATRVIEVAFAHGPGPLERDSLAALAATGTAVQWRGPVPATAVELDRDPVGTVRVAIAAPDGARVGAADALGTLDSAIATGGAAAFALRGVISPVSVKAGGENLHAAVQAGSAKSVVVLGPAGWESRFLLATLEAAGLPVTARIRVAPQAWVAQGRHLPLDTARHSVAVIIGALEQQTAGPLRAFVRAGGGVVLAPGAAGLDDLAPGRFGKALRPAASLSLPAGREQLVSRPITQLGANAVALDQSGASIKTAIQRVGAGRAVQLADEDTWRLVLASDAGAAAHAQLWLTAIALANPRDVGRPAADDDVAPLAALVGALGPAAVGESTTFAVDWERVSALLMFGVLLADWAIRRLGGKP